MGPSLNLKYQFEFSYSHSEHQAVSVAQYLAEAYELIDPDLTLKQVTNRRLRVIFQEIYLNSLFVKICTNDKLCNDFTYLSILHFKDL